MDIFQLKDLSAEERRTVLLGEAVKVEQQAYMRPLSQAELLIKKDELTNNSILKAKIEDEFSEVKKEYKSKLDPLKDLIHETLDALRNKAVLVKGNVYVLSDPKNKMMHNVDVDGNVLSSRPMLPEERQLRINQDPTTFVTLQSNE